MKFPSLLFFTLIAAAPMLSAQEGMQFAQGSWSEVLEQARRENKLVFMDAYTVWCGPCKMMAKNVFPDAKAGEYFNQHFVNVQVDMEKGEGIDLAQRYQVQVYPTLLFLNADGDIVHRAAGYHAVDEFIELGQTAADPNRQMAGMQARFAKGDRDPDFLRDYAMACLAAMDGSHPQVVDAFLATQSDWSAQETRELIYYSVESADNKLFTYIAENQSSFAELFGEQEVSNRLLGLILDHVYAIGGEEGARKGEQLLKKVFPENSEEELARFRMYYYMNSDDPEGYSKATVDFYRQYPDQSWDELNEAAWNFYLVVENPEYLREALGWAERSVALDANYYNMDTLASLYYKLGEKSKAKKAAKNAIKKGKEAGEDVSATQDLLEKIKAL